MVAQTIDKYRVSITVGTMIIAAMAIVGAAWSASARNTELDAKITENRLAIKRIDGRLCHCELDGRQLDRTLTTQAADIRYIKDAVKKIERYMFRRADERPAAR